MNAYIFPGQGSQFPGMAKDLYQEFQEAQYHFHHANKILGYDIMTVMFEGTPEELRQTKITQPAIFLHSTILSIVKPEFKPDVVAGHSLGEFSALVANNALSFEDGLKLVYKRAMAMQKACEINPSTMAAIIGLDDSTVEKICSEIEEIVVPANYNCPGQLVISGSLTGIEKACEKMKKAGAKRALPLPVGGAFHSPLMEPAREELAEAIEATEFMEPICPIYQNVNALPTSDLSEIKSNLMTQLTSPVKWSQSIQHMIRDNVSNFYECGPGKVLHGLVKKINTEVEVSTV